MDSESGSSPIEIKYSMSVGTLDGELALLSSVRMDAGEETSIAYPGNTVASLLFLKYEASERYIVAKAFGPSDRVLEAGAGIGGVTVAIARVAHSVIAYEPLPDQAAFCDVNLIANDAREKVTIVNAVLAPGDGPVQFNRSDEVYGSYAGIGTEYPGVLEQTMRPGHDIDRVVRENNINALHLDVEGGEAELLERVDLSLIDKLTMEVHPRMIGFDRTDDMLKMVHDRGLRMAAVIGGYNYPRHTYTVCFARPELVSEIQGRVAAPYIEQLSYFDHIWEA